MIEPRPDRHSRIIVIKFPLNHCSIDFRVRAPRAARSIRQKCQYEPAMNSTQESFGLNGLDRKLEKYVNFDGGTIFEAGANNGVDQSNSLYFERYRAWRSILVEPIPQRFFDCVVNRPKAIVEWGALVPPERRDENVLLTYCNLMTVTRGTPFSRAWEDDHLSHGTKFIPGQKITDFKARGTTISDILDKHRISHLDVLSLDIEGYEIPALQGLDLSRHRPHWLLIEVRDNQAMDDLLTPYYTRVDVLSHHDVLYRLRQEYTL